MKFQFDHSYTIDKNHKFRNKLGQAGFYLDTYQVEHPYSQFCKFIFFKSKNTKRSYYLEFVDNKGPRRLHTGFSLSSKEKIKNSLSKIKVLKPKYFHKNYNWKENSKDTLPGWNFITFPKRRSHLNIWITEYEKPQTLVKKNKKSPNKIFNSNEVDTIESFIFDISKKDLLLLSRLIGKPKNGYFNLQDGIKLFFQITRSTKLKSIVVSTNRYKKLKKDLKYDFVTKVNDQEGLMLLNPNDGWDLIITNK